MVNEPSVFEPLKFYCIHKNQCINIFIHDIFTEYPYNEPLKRNVVYSPIYTFLVYLLKMPIVNQGERNVAYIKKNQAI